jgi:hypothetical protein
MPLIRRHDDHNDLLKTITPTEMAKVLDADPTRPAYPASNARFNAFTGALIYERSDGQLLGCDIESEANYDEALAIARAERQQLKKSQPAPGTRGAALPARGESKDLGDEVVALLRAQGWGGLAPDADADAEPEAGPRDFGDEVADEYMKTFGNGKAAY